MKILRFLLLACLAIGVESSCPAQPPPSLPPELVTRLGDLLERDWEDRPQWADMAVGILKGGGMGSGEGWFTGAVRQHDWSWLSTTYPNAARDGGIRFDEIPELDQEDFDRIDQDRDGVITEADFVFNKNPFLEDSTPVSRIFTGIDRDSNGRITRAELEQWFDASASGSDYLSIDDLTHALGFNVLPSRTNRPSMKDLPMDPRWGMMKLLLSGEMGSFAEGPGIGDDAPEINLPLVAPAPDGEGLQLTTDFVTLASARGDRPIVLIFGSFT